MGAFGQADIDWRGAPSERSVDGHSLHEIVVLTMLPGTALKSASASFMKVVEHIAGAGSSTRTEDETAANAGNAGKRGDRSRKNAEDSEEEGTGELLAQLAGSSSTGKQRRSPKANAKVKAEDAAPAGSGAFNPFLNATLPRKGKS
jgi:hypothetical protein